MADEPVFDPEKLTKLPTPEFDPSKLAAKQLNPPEEPGQPYLSRAEDIPADIMQQATQGANTLAGAPGKIWGGAKGELSGMPAELQKKFDEIGIPKVISSGLLGHVQMHEGLADLIGGPMQAFLSPIMGPLRSMVSRPIEENTGIPKEATELAASFAMGRPRYSRAPRHTPTSDMLHAESDVHYDVARALPIQFMPTVGIDIANAMETALSSPRLAYRRHSAPETWGELRYLRRLENYYPTFADIDAARTALGRTARKVDAEGHRTTDAGAAAHAIELLDQEVRRIQPNQVMSGAHLLPDLHQTLDTARGNYAAYMRADIVERALDKALTGARTSGAGANVENKIRQAFGKILHDPKKAQRYTADELALFREVSDGNTVRNAARLLGKAAPTGIVSGSGSLGIGYLLGGKGGMEAVPAIGLVAKHFADNRARAAADRAMVATRQRSPLYQTTPQNPREFMISPYPSLSPLQSMRGDQEEESP